MNGDNHQVHLSCYRFHNDKMNDNEIMIKSCFLGAGESLCTLHIAPTNAHCKIARKGDDYGQKCA